MERKGAGVALTSDLLSMLSTLQTYESAFGPYNLQTLALGVQIAPLLGAAGDSRGARLLLERAATNLVRFHDGLLPVRLRALELLRDQFLGDGEFESAVAVQRELVNCRERCRVAGDPLLASERAHLERLLMNYTPAVRDRAGSYPNVKENA